MRGLPRTENFNHNRFKCPNQIELLCVNTSVGINRPEPQGIVFCFFLCTHLVLNQEK